jgi:putative tat pathway signal sequence
VRVGSFAAPLYGENAADASAFTLNLSAGRGAMLHCFCETPADWQTLELIYQPDFAAGQTVHFVVRRDADEVHLGAVPATLAEVGSVVDL